MIKMRHRRTNKSHAGKSTCNNTRNPCRKKEKQRIQRNENDGHMGNGGNHNNTNNHTWVRIMGTKDQWNDTNRGNIQQSNKTIHKNKVLTKNKPSLIQIMTQEKYGEKEKGNYKRNTESRAEPLQEIKKYWINFIQLKHGQIWIC